MILEIKNLHVKIGENEIIKGLDLTVKEGEMHVLMGPNGSGKTTLAKVIMGHPAYKVSEGDILADGKSILSMSTDKRAKLGLFLQFQEPVEIDGVGFVNFLRSSIESVSDKPVNIRNMLNDIKSEESALKVNYSLIDKFLNKGFSGGEKKKSEILQMSLLKPKIAILDEPDSGLDVDAIKIVAENINKVAKETGMGTILITHYNRILSYMEPSFVHIMEKGKIVKSGGMELVSEIEKSGYEGLSASK